MITQWIIFRKKDGVIGMLPITNEIPKSSKELEVFSGTEKEAIKRIIHLEKLEKD